MIGYTLKPDQYEQIQGQYYTSSQFFNCVQDINATWFLILSEQDMPEVEASAYAWILDLPQAEYIPPIPPPFPPK
jgi:hypothetical protein